MKKIIAVLSLVVLVAAAGLLYIKQKKGLIFDTAAVEAEAASILPGARPPEGLKGVVAMRPEPELRVAIFASHLSKAKPANLEGSDLRIIIASPGGGEPNVDEIKAKIVKARAEKAEEMNILSESPVMLSVGGRPYPGMEAHVELKEGGKKLRENVTIIKQGKQPVVLIFMGPEESFNESLRDEFLAALPAIKLNGLPAPGALPTPPLPKERPRLPKRPRPPAPPFRP